VEFFYGDPDSELVAMVHDAGALAGWQAGSVDEAQAATRAGCNFVVIQGTEAGGHVRGTRPLHEVLRDAVGLLDVPVVAAGGIGTARDVARALEAGASAVRVGTRFVAATESIAHPEYIEALLRSTAEDTVLTEAFCVGWPNAPHRVLHECIDAAEAVQEETVATASMMGEEFPVERFSSMPPTNFVSGNVRAMAMYAGTSVDAVRDRKPAADIVTELCAKV
jgi:NAD(P)H-dependent flavin oxidoreductase YrpB (nitropropane dioxygenase family)